MAAFSAVVAEPKFKLSLSASLNSMIFELDESGVLKPGAFGGVTCVGGAKGGLSGELRWRNHAPRQRALTWSRWT